MTSAPLIHVCKNMVETASPYLNMLYNISWGEGIAKEVQANLLKMVSMKTQKPKTDPQDKAPGEKSCRVLMM